MKFCVFRKSACEICLGQHVRICLCDEGLCDSPSLFTKHPTCACQPTANLPIFPTVLDKAKPKPQCEQLILSNISPLSESDMGENGLKFSFDRICVVSMAPGGARVSLWAGLGGWPVEEQGSPEQDSKLFLSTKGRDNAERRGEKELWHGDSREREQQTACGSNGSLSRSVSYF